MGEKVKKVIGLYFFGVSGLNPWFLTLFEASGSRFWRAGNSLVGSDVSCYQANTDSEGPVCRASSPGKTKKSSSINFLTPQEI